MNGSSTRYLVFEDARSLLHFSAARGLTVTDRPSQQEHRFCRAGREQWENWKRSLAKRTQLSQNAHSPDHMAPVWSPDINKG
jgi:hypothetical protein